MRLMKGWALLPLFAIALACSDDDDSNNNNDNTNNNNAANVLLTNGLLTDGDGRTLYYFTPDTPGPSAASACTGACVSDWPIFYEAQVNPGPGLDASLFGSILRSDGEQQTTYRGWPLYRFSGDSGSGQTNGDGVGGRWFVLPEPFYTVMLRRTEALGDFLVTTDGSTLYRFARDLPAGFGDAAAVSNCSGGCASNWPPYAANEVIVPSTLTASDLAPVSRTDGSAQWAYQGWPLYTFSNDQNPGDLNGDGAQMVWFVAGDYDIALMSNDDHPAYLANDAGRTMYFFIRDTAGTAGQDPVSACTGDCLNNWPIVGITDPRVVSLLSSDDFSSFTRPDGAEQATFQGNPLYYFANDTTAGDTNGDAVGGVWFVADPTSPVPTANVTLNSGRLSDGDGNTLYYFTRDTPGPTPASNCTGDCLNNWPVFYQESIRPGSGIDASLIGSFMRADGTMQSTYRGWPLYRFANDSAPGAIDGEGLGGVWFVLPEPFYTVMLRQTDDLGRFLVDAEGQTLYQFARDIPAGFGGNPAVSNCSGGCATNWPVFSAGSTPIVPSALSASDFAAVTRGDSAAQSSYLGWPLYRFATDAAPGDINGDGQGDVWYVADSYDVQIMANADAPLYLANAGGRAIYLFLNDTQGTASEEPVSACTGGCVTSWPLVPITDPRVASLIGTNDFRVLDRPDGETQAVFRGWPLYYYIGDTTAGDITGDGVNGVWELVDPTSVQAPIGY